MWGKASRREGRDEASNMEKTGEQERPPFKGLSQKVHTWLSFTSPYDTDSHGHIWLQGSQGSVVFILGRLYYPAREREMWSRGDGWIGIMAVWTERPSRADEDKDLITPGGGEDDIKDGQMARNAEEMRRRSQVARNWKMFPAPILLRV